MIMISLSLYIYTCMYMYICIYIHTYSQYKLSHRVRSASRKHPRRELNCVHEQRDTSRRFPSLVHEQTSILTLSASQGFLSESFARRRSRTELFAF